MIVIKQLHDIRSSWLDDRTANHLEKLFRTIASAYTDERDMESFSLEQFGPIVFLQDESDCRDLSAIGLKGPYRCVIPEYVERRSLADEFPEFYIATIVLNDDFCLTIASEVGSLDADTEAFLEGECD